MTTYTYQFLALDANGAPAPFAGGSLYGPDDTAFASPITVTDRDGTVGTSPTADRFGVVRYTVVDVIRGRWKSGTFPSIPVQALEAADTAAAAAQASADASAASAASAEQAAALVGAPAAEVVETVVDGQDFSPLGAWDFTGATVTGIVTVVDQGSYYELTIE